MVSLHTKLSAFATELNWISHPDIRTFAEKLIELVPEYFWIKPSSSTGKYHSKYAAGDGGLVRHSKAVAKILHEILSIEMSDRYSQDKKDLMIVAAMAHDMFKYGVPEKAGKYTTADHPLVCADFIRNSDALNALLPREAVEFVAGCIASHSGQWNTDYRSKKEILPKPQTGPQNLVHLADYLVSRTYLSIDFGDDYYNPPTEPEPDNAELNAEIAAITDLCKKHIESGMARGDLYSLISEHNDGNRNPNSITDIAKAKTLRQKLEVLNG